MIADRANQDEARTEGIGGCIVWMTLERVLLEEEVNLTPSHFYFILLWGTLTPSFSHSNTMRPTDLLCYLQRAGGGEAAAVSFGRVVCISLWNERTLPITGAE
jgi:hypothetical protein